MSNNQGNFGEGQPHMSKKDAAMYQQELQSAVPQVESIPSIKVIECASDKSDVQVSNTEWINSLSEPITVERGSTLSVNASFLQSRGIQNDLIAFNKSGNNRNDSNVLDYTYYTTNDGVNDKKTDYDFATYYKGCEDIGYNYKKSLLYRWGRLFNDYTTDIGGDGCGKKIVQTNRGEQNTGKPSQRLLKHPYLETASRVGVKEDQNAAGYFYNNEAQDRILSFNHAGIQWYEGQTYTDENGVPYGTSPSFFIFGLVPSYKTFEGDNKNSDTGDRTQFQSLRHGLVDIGYEDNTYFQGRPLSAEPIIKYSLGYLGATGTGIDISIGFQDSSGLTAANIPELTDYFQFTYTAIGGTYVVKEVVKLNEPEKAYLLANTEYTQEQLDRALFITFDTTRGNYLRPEGNDASSNSEQYFHYGPTDVASGGKLQTPNTATSPTGIKLELFINQSFTYLTNPDLTPGSRMPTWTNSYNNTSPYSPATFEYLPPQPFSNQAARTQGETQMYRYFGASPTLDDQYDDDENNNDVASIQKYDASFTTTTQSAQPFNPLQRTATLIPDTTGLGGVVSGQTIYVHRITMPYDNTGPGIAQAFTNQNTMWIVGKGTANETTLFLGNIHSFDTTAFTATYDITCMDLHQSVCKGGGRITEQVFGVLDWNFMQWTLPAYYVSNPTGIPIETWVNQNAFGKNVQIKFDTTTYDIPITKGSGFFGDKDPLYEKLLDYYPQLTTGDFYNEQKNICYRGGCMHFFAQNYNLIGYANYEGIYDSNSLPRFQFGNQERIIHTCTRYSIALNSENNRKNPQTSKNWEILFTPVNFQTQYDWVVQRNTFYYETQKNYMSATDIANDFTFQTHIPQNATDWETGEDVEGSKLQGLIQNKFCIPVWTSNAEDNSPASDNWTVQEASTLQDTQGYMPNSFKAISYLGGDWVKDSSLYNNTGVPEGNYNLWFKWSVKTGTNDYVGIPLRWYDPSKKSTNNNKLTVDAGGTGYAVGTTFDLTDGTTAFATGKVLTETGGVVGTCEITGYTTQTKIYNWNPSVAYDTSTPSTPGATGLKVKIVNGERTPAEMPLAVSSTVANQYTTLDEDIDNKAPFNALPNFPNSGNYYYVGAQPNPPSGVAARWVMREEPIMRYVSQAYPINYSSGTMADGTKLLASQMCGSTNFALQYNDQLSLFEYVFLHQSYATEFQTTTATGGDNSVKVMYPAQEEVENYDCFGGINISSWCRPDYLPGAFTNEEVSKNQQNYWAGYSTGINPDRNTTTSQATDDIGVRFLDKLGFDVPFIQANNSGISNYDFQARTGNMRFDGTTGNNLDIADAVIATREATESEPRLENHLGGLSGTGAPNRYYGDFIIMPYSFDTATKNIDSSDNFAGVRWDYCGGTFGSIGGERITNQLVGYGLPNTTGSQIAWNMLTAPKSFDPCFLGKWTSYTVACASSSIRATQLPEKTTNGYFLVVSDIIDSDGFILSLDGGSPSNIVAVIMKNYTSSDFIISYQSPITLYFPKTVVISKIRTKIIDNNFEAPVNIGKNSSVIYSIENNNPSIEKKYPSIEDIQRQDYQLLDMVNNQIKANVNKSGAGIMGQTASDINSISTSLTSSTAAINHPLAQIRNKIMQFDLPSMSEAEKHRFMTETSEGQVLTDDIQDFQYINNAVQMVSTPSNEDEGFNAGQGVNSDDLRDKLLLAIRQTQRNMFRRGIPSDQFQRVGEGRALEDMAEAARSNAAAEHTLLKQQQQQYTSDLNEYLEGQGAHIPSFEAYKETIAPEDLNNTQLQNAYQSYLEEQHGLPNYDDYIKAKQKENPDQHFATDKSVSKLFNKSRDFKIKVDSSEARGGGRPITLEGETVGQTPLRLGRQGYLLEPSVIADDDDRFNRLNERLAGHYSYGMRGQENLTAKERVKKANNQETLTREREYDKYYQNFRPSAIRATPMTFGEYQLDFHGNDLGIYQGRPTPLVAENRQRRLQVENEISTMGNLDYGNLLKHMGNKPRMKEVMNRLAPVNPDYNPDDFAMVREHTTEALASQPVRASKGRSDTGIGSSIINPSETTSLLAPTTSVKSDRISNYAQAQPYSIEAAVNKKDYEDISDTASVRTVAQSEASTIPTTNPFAQSDPLPEPLEVATQEEKKPHGKAYTSKRGLLAGTSKYFRTTGPQNQLKFHSKDAKKRAEEIANSYKPKFVVRGRTAAIGTDKYNERKAREGTNYKDMLTEMHGEELFHEAHIPEFLQTAQAQTTDESIATGTTETSE